MSIPEPQTIENTEDSPQVRQARDAAEAVELRVVWRQIETHHALELLRFTAYDDLPEALARWAYEVEVLALALRESLHTATAKHAEDAAAIAKLRRRVHDLTPRRRPSSSSRSSTPSAQVAA